MKQDTQDMKPLRKLLKGKVPTRQQYTNWITPVRKTYNKYASIIFNFLGVFFVYSDQNLYSTVNAVMFTDLGGKYLVRYYSKCLKIGRVYGEGRGARGEGRGASAVSDDSDTYVHLLSTATRQPWRSQGEQIGKQRWPGGHQRWPGGRSQKLLLFPLWIRESDQCPWNFSLRKQRDVSSQFIFLTEE